ncbi:MAG: gliding motility-associated C-terminal domain-containing protein [Flavobacteriales bacterium]|nr:gliding motility-associated C-terminal domain-containing protein [Flavobacteriales bacterium]
MLPPRFIVVFLPHTRPIHPLRLFGLLVGLAMGLVLRADHFSGASITYTCDGGGFYTITLDLYMDCAGVPVTPQQLRFENDCGTVFTLTNLLPTVSEEVSQICPAQVGNTTCNGGAFPGFIRHRFIRTLFLASCDSWRFSWWVCCRNVLVNVVNEPGTYVSTTLNNATAPCDNSPVFADDGIPFVCLGEPVLYNPGVTDPDGNTLSFALVSAQFGAPNPFPVTYEPGYSGAAPIPGITMDPLTGQMDFTPTIIGNYAVAYQVSTFDPIGNLIGTVIRDLMFVVIPCPGSPPSTNGLQNASGGAVILSPFVLEVCDGLQFCTDLVFTDPDPGQVISVVSNALNLLPGATFSVVGTQPATVTLCWTADAAQLPVNVYLQAADGTCPIQNVASVSVLLQAAVPSQALPNAGAPGNIAVCDNGPPLDLFPLLGGNPDQGGTWTTPSGAFHSGTYLPGTDVLGVYTYTVGNACVQASSAVTVSDLNPDPGTDASLVLCSNSAAVPLFQSIGGTPDVGGTWSGPAGPMDGIFTPGTSLPGNYVYTVGGVACAAVFSTLTVNVVASPNAGSDAALTLCSSGSAQDLFPLLGGAAQAGGTWVAPGGSAFGGTFNPAMHAAGAYVYTVTGTAPCANASAMVTVSISAAANAGSSATTSVCDNGAAIALFPLLGAAANAGGTWSGPGGAMNGSFTPGVDAAGIYTYTVSGPAPCPAVSSSVTVNVILSPNAGSDATLTLCSSGSAQDLFPLLGAAAQAGGSWVGPGGSAFGGTFDPAVHAAGVYVYTVNGTAPCANASATVTVNISAAANAGSSATTSVCDNGAAVALFPLLGAAANAGGTWSGPGGAMNGSFTPGVDAAGIYSYTVSGPAPCPAVSSSVTVNVILSPNAGSDVALTLCSSGGAQDLFPLLGGAAQAGGSWVGPGGSVFGGTFDPAVHAAGAYVYTVTGTAPCANASATVTVFVTDNANAGTDNAIVLCSNAPALDLFTALGGTPDPGGTWSGPGGAMSGVFTPGSNAAGTYTYTIAPLPPCLGAAASVSITVVDAPNAGVDALIDRCTTDAPVQLFPLLGAAAEAGGSWSSPGGGAFGGTIDPANAANGAYTYTVSGSAPCSAASATVQVNISTAPQAGGAASLSLCSTSPAIELFAQLGGSPDPGGQWSGPAGAANGSFLPASDPAGIYTYSLPAVGACSSAQSTVTIAVETAPDAGGSGTLQVCAEAAPVDLFQQLGGAAQPGGAWTAPDGSSVPGVFDPATQPAGTYTYTLVGNLCPAVSAAVQVSIVPPAQAGPGGSQQFCDSDAPVALFSLLGGTPDAGGTWTDASGNEVPPLFDPASSTPGTFTYSVQSAPQCASAQAVLIISVSPRPFAGTGGPLSLCDNSGPAALSDGLSGFFQNTGTWSAPNGGLHGAFFNPLSDVAGEYTYTVPGQAPCPDATAVVEVLVIPAPHAGSSAVVQLCSDQGDLLLTELLGGSPQLDGVWVGPEGTPVPNTFSPAAQNAGLYTYSVSTAAPCVPAESTVLIGISQAVQAGSDASLTLCWTDGPIELFSLLGAADQGGTWIGPNGAAFTGLLDPASANVASGVYTYTLVPQAPCAASSAQVQVNAIAEPLAAPDALGNGACAPAEVLLTSGYSGPGECLWLLSDGTLISGCGPQAITLVNAGNTSALLQIDPGGGCPQVTFALMGGILVNEPPTADFSVTPEFLTVQRPTLFASNNSSGATSFTWSVDGQPVSNSTDLLYTFPAVLGNNYALCLVAFADAQCSDTLCLPITVEDGPLVFVPNTFSPDGDGINDIFLPVVSGLAPGSYSLEVYDRWGRMLFRTIDPAAGWDGRAAGVEVPQGVYVWQLAGKDLRSTERVQHMGHVTLVR